MGSHSPLPFENQMEIDSGKLGSSGFVLLDGPQSVKIESNATHVGSVSDYFLSLTNGWDLPSFLRSLSKVLKALKIDFSSNTNPKDSSCSCVVSFPSYLLILTEITSMYHTKKTIKEVKKIDPI